MNRIEKLLILQQIPQFGAQRIGRLLDEVDFSELCCYDKTQLQQLGWNEKQIHRWFHPEQRWIDEALAWATQPNCRIISLFDEDYPFLLRQISTAPPLLFIKGNVASLSLPQIAIVGSRDYSHYGEYWAGQFTADLIYNGVVVTSGLAIGIDGFCHQRAVAENGQTIAVLGSGLNVIYPSRHRRLADQIIEKGGALVSEFSPNQPPVAENFPRRNRIISGLSLGTLVIEATINSGSLITARYALEQGREVFALPNTAQNPYSAGCHKLIKEGALLVESVQDILDNVSLQQQPQQKQLILVSQAPEKTEKIAKTFHQHSEVRMVKNIPELTACQDKIFEQIQFEPINIDDIAKVSELNIEMALIEVLTLELLGLIKQVDGGYVRK